MINFFYSEELLAYRPTPKLEDHPLSAVRDCLFNIFSATLHIWRPFLHPQPEDASCRGDRDPPCHSRAHKKYCESYTEFRILPTKKAHLHNMAWNRTQTPRKDILLNTTPCTNNGCRISGSYSPHSHCEDPGSWQWRFLFKHFGFACQPISQLIHECQQKLMHEAHFTLQYQKRLSLLALNTKK